MKYLCLIILLLFSLPEMQAAAPVYPVQRHAAPIEPAARPSLQQKYKQLRAKIEKLPRQNRKLPDKPLFLLTLLLYVAALGLATCLALGLIGILPAGWILWGQLGFLFDALLLLGLVFWGDSWAALAVLLISPFVLLGLYGLGLLVGGIIAPVLWAWIVGGLLVLFALVLLIATFKPKRATRLQQTD